MTNKITSEQIDLYRLLYSNYGRLTKFQDDIYGFVQKDNKVKLINFNNKTVMEQAYNISYIGENIIVLSNYDRASALTLIINRSTFETIFEATSDLITENEIIYQAYSKYFRNSNEQLSRIFDLNGNIIYTVEIDDNVTNVEIKSTDSNEYYIVVMSMETYEDESDTQKEKRNILLRYNKDKGKMQKLLDTDEFDVENIGYGLYKLSKYGDFSYVVVYDIINKKRIR